MRHRIKNPVMVLITADQYEALKKAGYNGKTPIIKLFMAQLTWLVTGIDEEGILYGYADLGMQCVEWGSLCHENELPTFKVGMWYLERDRYWTPKPDAEYYKMDSLVGV